MSRRIVFGLGLESGLEPKVRSEVEPEVELEIETGIELGRSLGLGKLARTGTQRSGIVKDAPKLRVPDTHP